MNILSLFQGHSRTFFNAFEEAAEINVKAAKELLLLCKNPKDAEKIIKRIHKLEHLGDEIAHKLFEELHLTLVPPMDREDIMFLTNSLDDVIDLIYASATRIDIYSLKKVDKTTYELAQTIYESTALVLKALPKLRSRKHFSEVHLICVEINKKENEGDVLLRKGLKTLFSTTKDVKKIIATKDIYEKMEKATDALEDIADVLSNLVTKYE